MVIANNKPEILQIWWNLNIFRETTIDELRQCQTNLDGTKIQKQNTVNEVLGLLSVLGMGDCRQLEYTWKPEDLWSKLNKWLDNMSKDNQKKYHFSTALSMYGIKDGWIDMIKNHTKNLKRLQGINALLSKVFRVVIKQHSAIISQ